MRIFVGTFIPEKICKKIKKVQKEIERQKLFIGKFTNPQNLHLTLKFLGEISEEKTKEIEKKLEEINMEKAIAELSYGGVFTDRHIKIIWIKIEGMEKLQKEIDKKLKEIGIKEEERFMSHLTIARVKICKKEDRERILEEIKKIRLKEKYEVESFKLVKSILKPTGPEYKILKEYKIT